MIELLTNPRKTAFGIAGGALTLMLAAAYLEHVEGLPPCALCMTQRIFVVVTGLVALVAGLHGRGMHIYGPLAAVCGLVGGGFAVRQLWLQQLPPDEVPACGPGIEYMLDNFPLADALRAMIMGTGNCAEVQWSLLGLSIPAWSLIGFAGMVIGGCLMFWYSLDRGE